jgi:hypothetical protein
MSPCEQSQRQSHFPPTYHIKQSSSWWISLNEDTDST